MFICDISVFNKYGKQRLDELLSPLHLDWRELVVMLVIEQVPAIPQTRLIPFLQTDKANVTKQLQAMEQKGLIWRESDGTDQRNKLCHLTDQGNKLVPQLNNVLHSWEAACFRGIDPEALSQYRKINEMISHNLMDEWNT